MKKKLKKVYKFKDKELEKKVLKQITDYLHWRGAYMVFPFKEVWEGKCVYGKVEVKLDIKVYKD